MFENSSIFILLNQKENPVRILETDAYTQKAICAMFDAAALPLLRERQMIAFDGSYKPNEEEALVIDAFPLPEEIAAAVKQPLGVQPFIFDKSTQPDIKAVFVGASTGTEQAQMFTLAFQRFRKEQYLSTKKFSLFFEETTFKQENRWGIGISETVDCVYTQNQLRFSSYYFTRQIFDLSEHYRTATDYEVEQFKNLEMLHFTDKQSFLDMADVWVRRKIAVINDSGILAKNPSQKIKSLAKRCGLEIEVADEKLVIPADKKKLKEILGFLDEEVYKGIFTKQTYITNSKRRM